MSDVLKYAVFPGAEIDTILTELFKNFLKISEKDHNLISLESFNCLEKEKEKILVTHTSDIPYVRIRKDVGLKGDTASLQKIFNDLLDKLLYEKNGGDSAIDYFSPGLSKKIGNNNLDIEENKQSAALLFSL